MSDCAVTIDHTSYSDDAGARQVEFDGEASGETFRFAVRYDVLEALSGRQPDGDAMALARHHEHAVCAAAARALGRGFDRDIVVVSENDLD